MTSLLCQKHANKFGSPEPTQEVRLDSVYLQSQHWGGGDRNVPEACWLASEVNK